MNKKLLVMLASLMLLASPLAAYAVNNEQTPAEFSINYVVGLTTTFVVTITEGANPMTFNARATSLEQVVEPNGQNKSINIPWANITNLGEVGQNFSVLLSKSNPGGITLSMSNEPDMTPAITLGLTGLQLGPELPASGIMPVFAEATFASPDRADVGTTSNSLIVTSGEPPVLSTITISANVAPATFDLENGPISGTFTAIAKDQHNNPIWASFEWSDSSSIGTNSTNADGSVLTFTPTSVGSVSLTVTASRGSATITSSPVTLTVTNVNG